MKLTSIVVTAVAMAALSGCGSDEPSAPTVDAPNTIDSIDEIPPADGDVSFMLGIAADQLTSQLVNATGYEIDGSTLSFLFDAPRPEDGGIGSCQIATTVLDAVASGEVDTIGLKYSDQELTCGNLL